MSAVDQVFAIPELLEQILIDVHGVTDTITGNADSDALLDAVCRLLIVRRVSHAFQAAIETSPTLRKAVCLEHAGPGYDGAVWKMLDKLWKFYGTSPKKFKHWQGFQSESAKAYTRIQVFACNKHELDELPVKPAFPTQALWRQVKLAPVDYGHEVKVWFGEGHVLQGFNFKYEAGMGTLGELLDDVDKKVRGWSGWWAKWRNKALSARRMEMGREAGVKRADSAQTNCPVLLAIVVLAIAWAVVREGLALLV